MYLFVVEPWPVNEHVDPRAIVDQVLALLSDFPAPELQASAMDWGRLARLRDY
jgi:hypothetical protein